MKVILGLIIVTDYPKGCKSAVVRRRRTRPYPGSHMPAIQVECEDGDDHFRVIKREVARLLDLQTLSREQIINLNHIESGGRRVVNYGMFLFHEYLDSIMHGQHGSDLRYVTRTDARSLVDMTEGYSEEAGIADEAMIAMFPDEIKAVRSALSKLHIPAF